MVTFHPDHSQICTCTKSCGNFVDLFEVVSSSYVTSGSVIVLFEIIWLSIRHRISNPQLGNVCQLFAKYCLLSSLTIVWSESQSGTWNMSYTLKIRQTVAGWKLQLFKVSASRLASTAASTYSGLNILSKLFLLLICFNCSQLKSSTLH